MKTLRIGLNDIPHFKEGLAIAVGYFDGFHLGHQVLLNETKKRKEKHHLSMAVLSFDPNPLVTLGRMKEEKYITSLEDRRRILEEMDLGIDYFLILDFNLEVANLLPETFIEKFMISMNVKQVICGFDFYFGQKGKGNGALLKTYHEFDTYIVGEVSKDDLKISTTRINDCLMKGNIEKANQLLTRPFQVTGNVEKGKQRGRLLGFPTANINYGAYYLPKSGVYAVKVILDDTTYLGMCNIGKNPTFDDIFKETMEVHLFDFHQEIYGKSIRVEFYHHMRDEKKFSSLEELKKQLVADQEEIQAYFA